MVPQNQYPAKGQKGVLTWFSGAVALGSLQNTYIMNRQSKIGHDGQKGLQKISKPRWLLRRWSKDI